MIIFKDIITDDEMISDSYDLKEIADGIAFEADCAMIEEGGVEVGMSFVLAVLCASSPPSGSIRS